MDPWPSYRRRARWLLSLGLVASAALALGAWRWPSLIAVGIVLLTVTAIGVTWLETMPCPRCRNTFFRAGLFHNAFSSYCLHCELPKWSLADGSISSAKRSRQSFRSRQP